MRVFEGGEAGLLETGHLRLGERLEGDVGECRAAPQRECLAGLVLREQPLETEHVELGLLDAEEVAGRAGQDPVGPKRLAQRVDVHLQRARGRARRRLTPDPFDQPVGRDRLVRAEQ